MLWTEGVSSDLVESILNEFVFLNLFSIKCKIYPWHSRFSQWGIASTYDIYSYIKHISKTISMVLMIFLQEYQNGGNTCSVINKWYNMTSVVTLF